MRGKGVALLGSPPHMRGKGVVPAGKPPAARITPAHAGKRAYFGATFLAF